jgi:sorting nexin-4
VSELVTDRFFQTQTTTDPFLVHLHSLLTYSHANRAVLKLRDQKQLDFEELSDYLSGVTQERDRLSAVISGHAGSTGLGLSAYLKDKVDALRGADDDRSRVEKMRKLDVKIKEVRAPYLCCLFFCVLSLGISCKTL